MVVSTAEENTEIVNSMLINTEGITATVSTMY
jgi:hypothetical protein